MKFDYILIPFGFLVLIYLVIVQIIHVLPANYILPQDKNGGEKLSSYEKLFETGNIIFDFQGNYKSGGLVLFINGEKIEKIKNFPLALKVSNGDVIEFYADINNISGEIFVRSTTENINSPRIGKLHRISDKHIFFDPIKIKREE